MLRKTGVKCKELFHVTDWYPTLLYLAGITETPTNFNPQTLDGFNIWHSISEGSPSPRTEILHNIDSGIAAIRVGDMKLVINERFQPRYKPPELGSTWNGKQGMRKFARLYNITDDPEERKDLSQKLPHVVIKLLARVWDYMNSPNFVTPNKVGNDKNARAIARENGYWGPWKRVQGAVSRSFRGFWIKTAANYY